MTCGVPQVSTSGSLLFLIHINDIANSPNKLSFRLFADDANIFHTSDDINDITVFNIQQKTCIKYLGVYINQKLNWKDQKSHVKTKA